jgi:acrylyl-CoA reductase (NADPH)
MTDTFRAWMISKDPEFHAELSLLQLDELPEGDVTIRVHYSSVNYKDALAMQPDGRVVRHYPMVPGVDLAGVVQRSSDHRFREGDQVIATGYGLGTDYYGGFSEYARLPADWVVPKPIGLSLRESMILGTAGFTAGLSVLKLQQNGLLPTGPCW